MRETERRLLEMDELLARIEQEAGISQGGVSAVDAFTAAMETPEDPRRLPAAERARLRKQRKRERVNRRKGRRR